MFTNTDFPNTTNLLADDPQVTYDVPDDSHARDPGRWLLIYFFTISLPPLPNIFIFL